MTPSLSATSASSLHTDGHASTRPSGSNTPATSHSSASNLITSSFGVAGPSGAFSTLQYLPLGCVLATIPTDLDLTHGDNWTELNVTHLALASWELDSDLRKHLIQLLDAQWIRAESSRHVEQHPTNVAIIRLWILPHDVGHATVNRSARKVHLALEHVIQSVTISTDVWHNVSIDCTEKFDPWACPDESSLFYLFNTLPSPEPSPSRVENLYSKAAMQDLLDSRVEGLKSKLYPFQARSAALMLQREASDELYLDPRLEKRRAPNGRLFYYCPRNMEFLHAPRFYSSQKSGVLAELMGSGKTIIALSLVSATKNHVPAIPPQYQRIPVRNTVGTLFDMAAAAVNRHAIPWKTVLASHAAETGEFLTACEKQLEANPPIYEIPSQPIRLNRNTMTPAPRRLRICSTTIIVVPLNLLHQWRSELQKHVEEDTLKVLIMDHNKKQLPPADELATFDVILFSRGRFEAEVRDGYDAQGRKSADYKTPPVCSCPYVGSSRVRDCTCFRENEVYVSPLRHLHFLRIMIDEGHSFSSSNSNAVQVAQKLVHAERRWVISGTPAKDDLLSVEVDLASSQSTTMEEDMQILREAALERRKRFDGEESNSAARTLGTLATHFLQVRPWSEGADWIEHVYRHEHPKKRTLSAFSECMGKTLGQLLIKTQPADMERDVVLPPLKHSVVRLKPSFFDKVTANLFVFVLTNNAVTSERTDVDYLFHPKSQGSKNRLITNLRLSNFFWSGWRDTDIGNAVEIGCKYLLKKDINCSAEDRETLEACINFAEEFVLRSESWKAMSRTHEIGLFVEHWPENSPTWALAKDNPPELYGATLLHQAQGHVNSRLSEDPLEELEAAGTTAVSLILAQSQDLDEPGEGNDKQLIKGMPASGIHAELSVERVRKGAATKNKSPQKAKGAGKTSTKGKAAKTPAKGGRAKTDKKSEPAPPLPTPRKRPDTGIELPSDAPLAFTRIIGTVSAKLSYLLDQILAYYQDEKVLVFYDGDNTAYYIAQCLDILHIKHEIYAKGISNDHRSKYIVAFAQDPSLRVLLMDVRLGALGLNANSASRVYFVNPVCRPSIEAQAVKRAHRIGQTKPVHVETLILSGTIEEAMFERSKAMTRSEHLEAKTLEDDVQITDIIQNAKLLPITADEASGDKQMAPLSMPQQLFGRPGRMAAIGTPPRSKRLRTEDVPDEMPKQPPPGSYRARERQESWATYLNVTPTSSTLMATPARPLEPFAPVAPAVPSVAQPPMQTESQIGEERVEEGRTSLFGDGGGGSWS
ncbi:P-loop containing nucleoside triphosphate hydrolase protein [Phyllosticta citrichinensis]|uniref:P-loop containing nucleoside triphosphate hydrolase protein n=1 Tax=Phyllosticta citrichinensis TaxID=1130410 RepID=A0ABR1Y0I0_9PEZI